MARQLRILFLLLSLAIAITACGGDDDTTGDGGSDGATTTAGGDVATVALTTSDGGSFTLDVTSCENPAESTVRLSARSETADLAIDATDGEGTLNFSSADGDRQGSVESAQVGDAGNVSITGPITPAGGGDESETFEVTGRCS